MLHWMGGSRRKLREKKRSTKNTQHHFFEQRRKLLAEKTEGRTITRVPFWRNLSNAPEHFHDHGQVLRDDKVVRREVKGGVADNPTLHEQSLDILGLELLCPKEKGPTERSSENSENLVVEDREGGHASPGKDLVATSMHRKSHGGQELLQSGTSLGESRQVKPRATGLRGVKGYETRQCVPERDSSTTNVLPQEVLAKATQAEKSISIPRESLSFQTAKPVAKPKHWILDILSDKNEAESKQKPSTEPYAAFISKGYGRTHPRTPENILQSSPSYVASKRALATSLPNIETLPAFEVAEQELQISELQLQRNHSYNSPKVSNASWRVASQENPNRIPSSRLDFMRIQDTIAWRPDSGNLNISPSISRQYRAENSQPCFLETSWDVPVTPNLRFISLDGLNPDWSCYQYSEPRCRNLEDVQSWSPDFLEAGNPVQSCQYGTEARSISEEPLSSFEDAIGSWDSTFGEQDNPARSTSEEPLSSFEDAIGSWDSTFREQDSPHGTFERGAKEGTAPKDEGPVIQIEDMESWDPDVLKQVNPGATFDLNSRSKERSEERLASFEEFVESGDPNFLEQSHTGGTIQFDSEARASSEDSLITFEDHVGSWDPGFLIQDNPTGRREIGLAAKSSSEKRPESFEDDVKPWEPNFLELENPAGSCEARSIEKSSPEESLERFADVGSWEPHFLEQNDPTGICRLGSKDRPTPEQSLPMFDDVGSLDSGFRKQEHPPGTCETCSEAKEERLGSFGILAML